MMTDFLKEHPYISMDEYMWKINPCLMLLMSRDFTRVHYLTEKEKRNRKTKLVDGTNLRNDLGMKIL